MLKQVFCAVLVIVSGSQAISADLFDGAKPRAIQYGDPIAASDTVGGYAIYPGDGHWTFVSAKAGSASTRAGDSTNLGTVQMMQLESRTLVARQTLTANLGAGYGSSWAGAPCAPGHLVSRNQGRGSNDNCMTIDPVNLTVDNSLVLFLSVVLTNSGANGRYYKMVLDLNPALLGMRGTSIGDWTPEVLAARPQQQAFLKKLSAWAETLQDKANNAFDYKQPHDAFAEVRSFRTLSPVPAVAGLEKNAATPASTVESSGPAYAIEKISFKIGDDVQTVKNALNTSMDTVPMESATPAGVPNPNAGKTYLYLRTRGIRVFFNKAGFAETIRLDPPFVGPIGGIKIGDTEQKVRELKGKPVRDPWQFGDAHAFLYVLDDTAHVRFDISDYNGVQSIFIMR